MALFEIVWTATALKQRNYIFQYWNEILLKDVLITQMACADNRKTELEEKYSQNLAYSRYFKIEGNKLVIISISEIELIFRAEERM